MDVPEWRLLTVRYSNVAGAGTVARTPTRNGVFGVRGIPVPALQGIPVRGLQNWKTGFGLFQTALALSQR